MRRRLASVSADGERVDVSRAAYDGFLRELRLAELLTEAGDLDGLLEQRVELKVLLQRAALKDSGSDETLSWAELRLRVDRSIGMWLTKTVGRGGRGSKSVGQTSKRGGASRGLPAGLNKQLASQLRGLWRVPGDAFETYLESCRTSNKPASRAGATAVGRKQTARMASRPQQTSARRVPAELIRLAMRFLGQADVHIGPYSDADRCRAADANWPQRALRGSVLITQPPTAHQWKQLLKPAEGVREILVVAPFVVDDSLQLQALRLGWLGVVIPEEGGWLLLYRGNRSRALQLMFAERGLFLAGKR